MDRLFIDESAPEAKIVCTRKLDDSEESRSFSPLEFLAEVFAHIPNSWEQTTRFYGVYSARSRPLLEKADLLLQSIVDVPHEPSRKQLLKAATTGDLRIPDRRITDIHLRK